MTEFSARYGPWALVVGASAGVGAAAADEAASRGLHVLTVARRSGLLEERAAAMRDRHGVEVRTVAVDLADPGAVGAVVDAADGAEVGTLVYNAAAEPRGAFLDVPLDEHLANLTVNCTVPTVLCHHFGQGMAARGRGAVVLVSSMGALQGGAVFASYFAAKAYEWILAEGLWAELGRSGVDAFAYLVGATRTEQYRGQADGSSDRQSGGAGRQGGGAADRSARNGEVERLVASLAEDDDASDLALARLRDPSDPEDVGRHLFDLLGRGPAECSHPADEATLSRVLRLSRRDAVIRMSTLTGGIRA